MLKRHIRLGQDWDLKVLTILLKEILKIILKAMRHQKGILSRQMTVY